MLITEKKQLKKYSTPYRVWQGIASIEVTKKGRIFSTFYSGNIDEEIGNYVVLLKSDDGVNFTEPIAAVYKEGARCYDVCIWIDPLERLWLIWSVYPNHGVYGVICDNPDADELEWGEEFFIGNDVMMNRPTVLSTGEWMFPISVWGERVWGWMPERRTSQTELGAFVYKTVDKGKTFTKMGGITHPDNAYDEHMVLELNDGRLMMLIRTMGGIGASYSYDRGKTWSEGVNSGFGGPGSRFHIRRLKSGRVLLINHCDYSYSKTNPQGRNNLMALLSDDDCKTWKYKLMLDERDCVSYPDATETEDGFIYVTYDRERGCGKKKIEDAYAEAREILYAKITEEDIMSGEIINPDSKLKCVISRLGKYEGKDDPFKAATRQKNEYAPYYASLEQDYALERIYRILALDKRNFTKDEAAKFDGLIDSLDTAEDRVNVFAEIFTMLQYMPDREPIDLTEMVREEILADLTRNTTAEDIIEKFGLSKHYFNYTFNKCTSISVEEYRDALRMTKAKKLLAEGAESITEVSELSGYEGLSNFIEAFMKEERLSPSEYREIMNK